MRCWSNLPLQRTIVDLVHDYLRAAEDGIREMKRASGVSNLPQARREKLIPAQGSVEGQVSFLFSFHGVGCAITFEHYRVDFDFDEDGECAGFDAWKLWQFAKSRGGHYGPIENRDVLMRSLQELEDTGQVQKTGRLPNPEMYRLRF
jgi:hypothetical protein